MVLANQTGKTAVGLRSLALVMLLLGAAALANGGSHTVSSYRINADTGALSLIGSVASGRAPVAIVTSGSMQ